MKKHAYLYFLLFLLIAGLGIAVRVAQFPDIPPGFNQDEADSGYETYSLAKTGKDKWGNMLPAYFPSWGSGQNVLMAYLSVPAVKMLGLNIYSVRLVPLLLGILTLPLCFFCLRPLGRFPAFSGMLLLSIVPWHFMLSRWALESNLLPFFMLLGCGTLSQALITRQKRWIIPSLVPFALALYAYGTTIIVLPVFFGLLLILHYRRLRGQAGSWLTAFGIFLLIAFPFLLFFTENYLLGRNLAWTDHLPFSTPMCPANRIDQAGKAGLVALQHNMRFLLSGCNDGTSYNLLQGSKLLFYFIIPLSAIGFLAAGYRLIRQRRKQINLQPADIVVSVFAAWFAASLVFPGLFDLNVNRFNHFYLPCLAMAIWLIAFASAKAGTGWLRWGIPSAVVVLYSIESFFAIRYYFQEYPASSIKAEFNAGLQDAFHAADQLAVRQIRVTSHMQLPYVYTLFYLQYPPDKFRKEVRYEIENGCFKVDYFGRYVFYDEYLDTTKAYGYLRAKDEFKDGAEKRRTVFFSNEFWEVGIIQ